MLMAPTPLPTPVTLKNGDGFPVAGIVFICIGGYLVIFAVVIVIRKCIIAKHGSCCPPWLAETCLCTQCCTGSDGVGCLKAIAQACNCSVPNKRQCVDAVCPSKQWCDDTFCSCMSQAPGGECCKCLNCQNCCACKDCCGECGDCADCGGCADCCDDCHCQCCAQPETISCCCIEVKLSSSSSNPNSSMNRARPSLAGQPYPYPASGASGVVTDQPGIPLREYPTSFTPDRSFDARAGLPNRQPGTFSGPAIGSMFQASTA